MRLHRAVLTTLAAYALFTLAAVVVCFAAWGPPARSGLDRAWAPLAAAAAVALLAAAVLARRATPFLVRPLQDLAAAAWSGVEGRLRTARDAGSDTSFAEVREAVTAFNAMVLETTHALASLDVQKSTLEAVLTHMSDALIVLDARGEIVLVNPAAERIFGLVASDVLGQRLIEAFRHFELDAVVRQAEREQKPLAREIELHHPVHRLLRVQVNPAPGARVQFHGMVVVAQDVTDQHRTDIMRREFVANVSHELRTPLTSVRALAEALAAGAARDREAGPRFLQQIVTEIDRLALLVNDLLDLSAIESGSAKMEMESVPVEDVIEEVVAKYRPMADRHHIALRAGNGAGPGAASADRAWADRTRLVQAVANLVDNAIKYTPEGGAVTVSGESRNGMVAVSVTDTGIGIAAEHLPRIFERFYRADGSRSRALGGTGLGLSIVKHIATSHGGEVEVQSTEGKGSRFTLLVPRAPE
jgi:two-component system phosphate regulon sensor histidine kinase PhoR